MYCPRCKKEISDNSKYCNSCGSLLNGNEMDIDDKYKNKISKLLLLGFILGFIIPPAGLIVSIMGVILAYSIKRKSGEQIKNLNLGIAGIVFSCFFIIIYTAIIVILITNSIDRYDQFAFGKYYCKDLKPSYLIIENNEFKVLEDNNYINIGSYTVNKRKIQRNKCFEYKLNLKLNTNSKLNAENITLKRCYDDTTITFDEYRTYNCIKE